MIHFNCRSEEYLNQWQQHLKHIMFFVLVETIFGEQLAE